MHSAKRDRCSVHEALQGFSVISGMESAYSLYNKDFATFGENVDNIYNQKDAEGFINLFGLPVEVMALMKRKLATAGRKEDRLNETLGGRFSRDTALEAENFNASISVDSRLYLQDIEEAKPTLLCLENAE